MSNVIPIVSSSPPPLDDDDADFGWEDEDDEFGNFASAPAVSAAKDTSDGSFEVNWSNSEASVSAQDSSNGITFKGASCLDAEQQDGDSSKTMNRKESHPLPSLSKCEDGTMENNDFQKFAQSDDSSNPSRNQNSEKPVSNTESPTQSSVQVQNEPNSCIDGVPGEEEFQDFAQFNDALVSELSTDEKSETEDGTGTSLTLDHSTAPHSDPGQCTEDTALSTEPATTAVIKNNESVYSNASTIDSGVFSADLSPSQPPDGPNLSQSSDTDVSVKHNEGEVSTKENDSSLCDSSPAGNPVNGIESLRQSSPTDEHSLPLKSSVSSEHEMPLAGTKHSETSDSSNHEQAGAQCSDSGGSENWGDYKYDIDSESSTSDAVPDKKEEDMSYTGESGSPICVDQSDETDQHSIYNKDRKAAVVAVEDNVPGIISQTDDEEEQTVDQQGDMPTNDEYHSKSEAAVVDNVSQQTLSDSQDESEWGYFDSASDETNKMANEEVADVKHDLAAHNDIYSEQGSDLNNASQEENISKIAPQASFGDTENNVVNVSDCKSVEQQITAVSVESEDNPVVEKDYEPCELTSESAPGTAESSVKEPEEHSENVEDKEFGDFSSHKHREESDPLKEVDPITFRTSICEDEANESVYDDDFSFGRERPPALDNGNGDDDDDFGAFGTADKESFSDDNNDDFGDFDSAENFRCDRLRSGSKGMSSSGDDFGDFGSSEPAEGDAGWADFGTASTACSDADGSDTFSEKRTSLPSTASESLQSKALKLQQAVCSSFPMSSEHSIPSSSQRDDAKDQDNHEKSEGQLAHGELGQIASLGDESLTALDTVVELGLCNIQEAKQQTWTVVQHPAKKDPKVRLWGHLRDVDSSHALMYGWPTSFCSKEVFSVLHIDTQNILFAQKKQAVPFYAAGLSILEPIRGSGGQDGKKEKNSMTAIQPTLLDTSRQEVQQNTGAQEIPPVDFDWSVSGLTNPLTANTLDLDFLVVQGSDSYEKTSVFKADNQDSTRPSLQPLEEILKKSTPTAKLATHEVLSPEALRILDKMPDLSFMQSRVLMFPVKQS